MEENRGRLRNITAAKLGCHKRRTQPIPSSIEAVIVRLAVDAIIRKLLMPVFVHEGHDDDGGDDDNDGDGDDDNDDDDL